MFLMFCVREKDLCMHRKGTPPESQLQHEERKMNSGRGRQGDPKAHTRGGDRPHPADERLPVYHHRGRATT